MWSTGWRQPSRYKPQTFSSDRRLPGPKRLLCWGANGRRSRVSQCVALGPHRMTAERGFRQDSDQRRVLAAGCQRNGRSLSGGAPQLLSDVPRVAQRQFEDVSAIKGGPRRRIAPEDSRNSVARPPIRKAGSAESRKSAVPRMRKSVQPRFRFCGFGRSRSDARESPARRSGRGVAACPAQSPLGLRVRDQMRVKPSLSSSSKRLA
jgi:hypothetical protein